MQAYFQNIISEKQKAGLITAQEALVLSTVFQTMSYEQLGQIRDLIEQEPSVAELLLDNVLRKFEALGVDDLDSWKRVIAYELEKLDAVSDSHAES
jgi:hypothetical protein